MTSTFRLEHDALGDVEVPADRLWGAQTQRSIQFFAIGVDRFRFTRPVIRALGIVKKAAALANEELGELDAERARADRRGRRRGDRGASSTPSFRSSSSRPDPARRAT